VKLETAAKGNLAKLSEKKIIISLCNYLHR